MRTGTQTMPLQRQEATSQATESLSEKLSLYLRYWPFFLASIITCLFMGYLFVKSAVPLYTVSAKMLINNESNGQHVKQDNEPLINPKKVDDEVEVLRSRTIMDQVVSDLQLWTSYFENGSMNQIDLYKNSPVNFNLIKPTGFLGGQRIVITIKDKHTFELKQPNSISFHRFGTPLKSSFGAWKLSSNERIQDFIGKSITIQVNNQADITDWYMSSFHAILLADESSVVQLSIKETVPERGADVINSTIMAYNRATIAYKNKVNQSTLSFLKDRLDSITAELNSVEKRVEKYKSTRGITDLSAESQSYLENVKGNDSRMNEVNVQLQIINEIQKYINSPVSDGNAPATTGISDPGLVALVDQLIKLEGQKDRLLATTPAINPIFVPLNRQISTTKNSIRENIKGIKRSYVATRNQLQKYNSGFESSIKKLPEQEREFITIKRQQSIKEELYIYLLQKREEAGMENASKLLDSRIIDQAHFGAPETQNANFTYALAFIFGLAFPAGILFAKDALNNKITSVRDVESMVAVPILGELSHQNTQPLLLVAQGSRTMISEQFRILRTKLSHINGRSGNGKVTMLTSGMPGEGKSMISRNLAAVMAAAGRKTVLIDADLRKPQLAKLMDLSNDIGLSDFLNGSVFKEQIVKVSNVHPQLFFITAGTETDNPSELLEKPAMGELFEWLRMYFDEIIIDTPPIQLVTDALVITPYADSNLYVLRQNYTYKSQIKYINQIFWDGNFKNLHLVLNCASASGAYNYPHKYAKHYYEAEPPKFRLPFLRKY
jgi:tyrosine-protein kinase Etk/Wzc